MEIIFLPSPFYPLYHLMLIVFSISLRFVFDLLVKVRKHHPPNCEHLHSCRCEGKHLIEQVRELSADLQY